MRAFIISSLTIALIIGCSSTGVIPLSQDIYFIGKKDGSPGLGHSFDNKVSVLKEAHQFCNKKGKEVQILSENAIPSAPARLGSYEIQFKCVEKGGVGKPLESKPDIKVEIKK